MTENITLAINTQQQQQKTRPLGRVRIQGQRAAPPSGVKKSEDFSVQGEAYSAAEKQASSVSSSGSLPPIGGHQSPQQRQPSVQLTGSPPSDAGRLARLQQREQELLKKLQDAAAREKLLKEQVERLEKMLATAQKLLEDEQTARQSAEDGRARAASGGDKYRKLYEDECRAHLATGEQLEQLREQHRLESARLQAQAAELKAQLEQLTEQHEARVARLLGEHQEALADRDKRIENLKRQVAGALGTNSHERQSQIDQLNRELQKMADELEALRKAARSGGCQQCPRREAAMRDQGEQVRQLRVICQRFRGQLGEQEQMLLMLMDKKPTTGAPSAKR